MSLCLDHDRDLIEIEPRLGLDWDLGLAMVMLGLVMLPRHPLRKKMEKGNWILAIYLMKVSRR